MKDLREFLSRYADQPFEWGADDCSLILADWWRENHDIDPAEHLRGTYHDEKSCHRVVFYAGGLARLVSGICKRAGATTTRDPKDGDFAVIALGSKRICGIKTGSYWAIRNDQPGGVGFVKQVRVIKAWAI